MGEHTNKKMTRHQHSKELYKIWTPQEEGRARKRNEGCSQTTAMWLMGNGKY